MIKPKESIPVPLGNVQILPSEKVGNGISQAEHGIEGLVDVPRQTFHLPLDPGDIHGQLAGVPACILQHGRGRIDAYCFNAQGREQDGVEARSAGRIENGAKSVPFQPSHQDLLFSFHAQEQPHEGSPSQPPPPGDVRSGGQKRSATRPEKPSHANLRVRASEPDFTATKGPCYRLRTLVEVCAPR